MACILASIVFLVKKMNEIWFDAAERAGKPPPQGVFLLDWWGMPLSTQTIAASPEGGPPRAKPPSLTPSLFLF